jgi:class 3 adenylate cyclase
VDPYTRDEAAEQAGVDVAYIDRLVGLGIVTPVGDRFSTGDIRRLILTKSIEDAGISGDGLAEAIRRGDMNLDFLNTPAYDRFSAFSLETFREASDRTGIPMELMAVIREAVGLERPSPDDRLRTAELAIVRFVELQVSVGFRPAAIERLLRVQGDATRRMTESEGAWWYSEVIQPAMADGRGVAGMSDPEFAEQINPLNEDAILAMYHVQQARAWTGNIIESLEGLLAAAGLHSRLERPPAVCFIDIAGYTRFTQERGDDVAADLAATVATLVQRASVRHGGKAIKWLGDGVMFYFRDPGFAVTAALDMLEALRDAGLPPAHVGLHAGPVLFQQGDYFGQTVNLSARIAAYAQAGEVLVSREAAAASRDEGIAFVDVGAVELKGVADPVPLLRAARR